MRLALSLTAAMFAANASFGQEVRLNEIRTDQIGADIDEFFELKGKPGTALDGLTVLVIGDGVGASGVIEFVLSLDGLAIPDDGHFLAVEETHTLAPAEQWDIVTDLAFENSDNVTYFLVSGFTGMLGDDLDAEDDCVLDSKPWEAELDRIALIEEENPPGETECHYGPPTLGPDGTFAPGLAIRCESEGTWTVGVFDPVGTDDTPGVGNPQCPAGPLCSDVVLNELRIDQPGGDDDEYFEVRGEPGASLDNVCLIVIGDGDGDECGIVEDVIDLSGNSIRENGLFLVAEDEDVLGAVPNLVVPINFENGDNRTFVLGCFCSAKPGDDLDTDDDGILDVIPWKEELDSVSITSADKERDCIYSETVVGPDGDFLPAHIYRCDPTDEWTIGPFDPTEGDDTPGASNALCPLDCPEGIVINELRIDQPGGDNDEYFELMGAPGTSLDGVCLVVIGDGSDDDCGVVEEVVDMSGFAIRENGLFLVAEDKDTLGALANLIVDMNLENGDNRTFVLACGCTTEPGDDLDTDDDGILDVQPWLAVLDDMSLTSAAKERDCIYSETIVGPDGEFLPAHVYRCVPGGDWLIGGFDPEDGDDTPGAANPLCPIDCPDGLRINEIRIDQPGGDNDEYFELKGDAGTSLDDVCLIVIGDGSGDECGVVEAVVALDGSAIRENGLFLVAEDEDTLGATANLITDLAFENGDNRTFVLACGCLAEPGDDLDADDDGVLDFEPWVAALDSLSLKSAAKERDCIYSKTIVGPDGDFVPAHVFRCEPSRRWRVGAFDPEDGLDTPGGENPECLPCPTDLNGDNDTGFVDLQMLLDAWGPCEGCLEDFDMSGDVGNFDLILLLSKWGPCP